MSTMAQAGGGRRSEHIKTPDRESTAPVTFGQLSVLRSLEYITASGHAEANGIEIFAVPAGVNVADAGSAWLHLVSLNESLRTVYYLDAQPRQIVKPFQSAELNVVELEEGTPQAAMEAARDSLKQPFAIDTEKPWRAFVAEYRGRPRFVVCVLHHITADCVSCGELHRQFSGYLSGKPAELGLQPVELAIEQQSSLLLRRQAIEFWARAWQGFVAADRTGNDIGERVQAAIYSRAGMVAASKIAGQLKISLQAVVLAVTYLVLFQLTGRSSATLGLMAGNRFNKRWSSVVTSMSQLAPLTVSAAPGGHPEDFLRSVYIASLEAYLHGCYSIDELREQLTARGHTDPDPMNFDSCFTFTDEGPYVPTSDAPVVTTIEWQEAARRTGARFNLLITAGEGIHLTLRASPTYIEPDLVGTFLASVEAALVSIANDAPSRVDAVRLRPIRNISPRPL
jgi:hypothetical protein